MLNSHLLSSPRPKNYLALWTVILLGEMCVVILEFAMSACIMKSVYQFRLRKLLFTMIITNAASFLLGILWILL